MLCLPVQRPVPGVRHPESDRPGLSSLRGRHTPFLGTEGSFHSTHIPQEFFSFYMEKSIVFFSLALKPSPRFHHSLLGVHLPCEICSLAYVKRT